MINPGQVCLIAVVICLSFSKRVSAKRVTRSLKSRVLVENECDITEIRYFS